MDTSGYFISIMVFIGIFYIIISQILKDKIKQNEIEKQNSWKKNINNYPKHNR